MRSQLEAVLFDLDGVIVDTARYHYLAWKKLADQEDIYFDEKINERLKGVSRSASLDIILEQSNREYSQLEKQTMMDTKNRWYLERIELLEEYDILPGVVDFLKSLKNNGIKCAICSASKSAEVIVGKLGITHYFDDIVGGKDIKRSKPDPEVFLIAADRIKVMPSACVVLEDSYAGLEGAKKAEMKAVGLGDQDTLSIADVVYKDMSEITIEKIIKLFDGV